MVSKEVGYRFDVSTTLNNIGEVYRGIGKPQKALEDLEKALPISQEVGDRFGVATTLSNIGGVYYDINRTYAKALCIVAIS